MAEFSRIANLLNRRLGDCLKINPKYNKRTSWSFQNYGPLKEFLISSLYKAGDLAVCRLYEPHVGRQRNRLNFLLPEIKSTLFKHYVKFSNTTAQTSKSSIAINKYIV